MTTSAPAVPAAPGLRRCLVATGDLMGWSRLSGVVRHAGLDPKQVRGANEIATHHEDVAAVIVDLSDAHGGVTAVSAAAALDSKPLVIAVGPHVDGALLSAAREAGAQEVLPHSAVGEPLAARLRSLADARQTRPE